MSELQTVQVDFKNEDLLVETLQDLGYNPVIHENGIEIKAYHSGKTNPTAHVVVSKNQFGGYTDCGFERKNGQYIMHIDEMDHNKFKSKKLKQYYAKATLLKKIKGRSQFSILSQEEKNGKIHIRLSSNI